ncbi:hypothetical protein EVG20_g3564 [Dentipellis fragilis]|uniref:Shugoshin C-terminal domain-containing protein n=1 Tax=Dentipellis fragilis TaxID=205917 RepID=A0A4Y9Z1E2_9AGAM|nr:hypothetical protein EVG20_g3564 [Dentipellis fragilis]
MSRRDSRASVTARQNDALFEFENFKKKFLLANRHITKLNSTLSVRIEELNAQISSLYVENLRLRASELALAAQLKKERERSQRVLADTENATHALIKHLGAIRKNHNIPPPPTLKPASPPKHSHSHSHPPRVRRAPSNPDSSSPHAHRLARAPGFPQIHEEDEPDPAPDEDVLSSPSPTPAPRGGKRKAAAPTLSLSPPPSSPPVITTIQVDVDVDEHLLKPSSSGTGSSSSSSSGSRKRISRRQSGLISIGRPASPVRPPSPAFGSPMRREAGLAEEEEEMAAMSGEMEVKEEEEDEILLERAARREKKKRAKAREEAAAEGSGSGRTTREKRRVRESEDEGASSVGVSSIAEGSKLRLKDVTNSNSHGGRRALPPLDTNVSDGERQQTPETDIPSSALTHASTSTRPALSTPATTPAPSHLPTPRASSPVESEALPAGGREKRVRKSINYAEPKLNTKMRKPTRVHRRRRNAHPCPHYTVPSRGRPSTRLRLRPQRAEPDPAPCHSTILTVRGRVCGGRSRARGSRLEDEDDESAGEQADAEFPSGMGMRAGWVNVEGRRRSTQVGSGAGASGSGREVEELRRHSMAV